MNLLPFKFPLYFYIENSFKEFRFFLERFLLLNSKKKREFLYKKDEIAFQNKNLKV